MAELVERVQKITSSVPGRIKPMTYQIDMYVVGEMKMGIFVSRAGLQPTSLAFQASVLPLHHVGSLMSPLYPCLPVYAAPCPRGQCRFLHVNKKASHKSLTVIHDSDL